MFDLSRLEVQNEQPTLVLGHTDNFDEAEPGTETCVGVISVWMRRLTGKDYRAANNASVSSSRKGAVRNRSGDVARMRVCRSVTRLDGLAHEGTVINLLTEEIYDRLPQWVIEKLLSKVQELNGELKEDDLDEGE